MPTDDRYTPQAIALGSWNTWSRLSFEDARDVVQDALDSGIRLFDICYYWDKPHTEVVFGHILRTIGVRRSEYQLAEKLWLWDYPEQTLATQLDRALVRLGQDDVDHILVPRPANVGLDMTSYLADIDALLRSGKARSWGLLNWGADVAAEAVAIARRENFELPRIDQLQYNLARRSVIESPDMQNLLQEGTLQLQPSFVLEGGILAGKLERDRMQPEVAGAAASTGVRNIARDAGGIRPAIRQRYAELKKIADGFGVTTARLAVAFALVHPHRATVLVGVSSKPQLADVLGALDLAAQHGDEILTALEDFRVGTTSHPELFNPRAGRRLG